MFSYGPAGVIGREWFREVVAEGSFAVYADKAALGPVIESLIGKRIAHADREGDVLMRYVT